MKSIYFLLLISMLPGCMKVAFILYGIKSPDQVSLARVENKIDKHQLTHFNHYILADSSSFSYFFNEFTDQLGSSSVNNLIIFDKEGLILPIDSITCSSDLLAFDNLLNSPNRADVKLDAFVRELNPISLHEQTIDFRFDEVNYYVFFSWATWAGRLNKDITKDISKEFYSKYQNRKDIQAFYLNLDIIEKKD